MANNNTLAQDTVETKTAAMTAPTPYSKTSYSEPPSMFGTPPAFGPDPVTTLCTNCQKNVSFGRVKNYK